MLTAAGRASTWILLTSIQFLGIAYLQRKLGSVFASLYQSSVTHLAWQVRYFSDSVFRHAQMMGICPGILGSTFRRDLFSPICEPELFFRRCCVMRTLCTAGGVFSEHRETLFSCVLEVVD